MRYLVSDDAAGIDGFAIVEGLASDSSRVSPSSASPCGNPATAAAATCSRRSSTQSSRKGARTGCNWIATKTTCARDGPTSGSGFRIEGTLREAAIRDGRFVDLTLMSLLEHERAAARSARPWVKPVVSTFVDERSLDVLDWDAVRGMLARQTMTDRATARATALVPSADLALVRLEQAATTEMRRIAGDAAFALPRVRDVGEAIERAARGGTLGADDLRDIGIALAAADAAVRRVRSGGAPVLEARAAASVPTPEVAAAIDRAIGERGDVLDRASPALARIRRNAVERSGRSARPLRGDPALAALRQSDSGCDRHRTRRTLRHPDQGGVFGRGARASCTTRRRAGTRSSSNRSTRST